MSQTRAEIRYPIQLRIGRSILKRADKAAWDEGISRNTWITEAIQRRLRNNGVIKACRVTAAELMADRVPLMIRLDELTLELLNEAAEDDSSTRTIWIIDAVLASLTRQPRK